MPLSFDFALRLREGLQQQAVSSIIVLIDNQTVGMMRLDMTLQVGSIVEVLRVSQQAFAPPFAHKQLAQ